jgi:hypothetical protein
VSNDETKTKARAHWRLNSHAEWTLVSSLFRPKGAVCCAGPGHVPPNPMEPEPPSSSFRSVTIRRVRGKHLEYLLCQPGKNFPSVRAIDMAWATVAVGPS